MARYAIPSARAFGVSVGALRREAKRLGRSHRLALELWATGHYEARMLACFLADPEQTTPALMDRWCRDFDNWAICDTACFHLFDRTDHAFSKVELWAKRRAEFEKRAAFALLASLALHRKTTCNAELLHGLALIEREASDDRNFVKKAVSWALRAIGRRNETLRSPALALSRRLAAAEAPAARFIGKEAVRALAGRVARRA